MASFIFHHDYLEITLTTGEKVQVAPAKVRDMWNDARVNRTALATLATRFFGGVPMTAARRRQIVRDLCALAKITFN